MTDPKENRRLAALEATRAKELKEEEQKAADRDLGTKFETMKNLIGYYGKQEKMYTGKELAKHVMDFLDGIKYV